MSVPRSIAIGLLLIFLSLGVPAVLHAQNVILLEGNGTGDVAITADGAVVVAYGTGVSKFDRALNLAWDLAVEVVLPHSSSAAVAVYDLLGREVRHVHSGYLAGGVRRQFAVDGTSLASGVYLLRVQAGDVSETRLITIGR